MRRYFAMGHYWPVLALMFAGSFLYWVAARERHAAGDRRTRVALTALRPAIERFLLENEGECPAKLAEVLPFLGAAKLPSDAWGRPLRLVCPSVREGVSFVLMSDGPDGVPGGRDRIEY